MNSTFTINLKTIAGFIFLSSFVLNFNKITAQQLYLPQIEYDNEMYWLYESVDTATDAYILHFFNSYDSLGKFLGWTFKYPKDGKWIQFYEQKPEQIARIFNVKDSLIHGEAVVYFHNGQLDYRTLFFKGQYDGPFESWYSNGVKSSETTYQYDENKKDYIRSNIIGLEKGWDENGTLIYLNNYQLGEKHGHHSSFHPNGNLKELIYYENDRQNGPMMIFHSNGVMQTQYLYKNDTLLADEPQQYFHPNSKLAAIGALKYCKKIGNWTFYHDNGNKVAEGNYSFFLFPNSHGPILYYAQSGYWQFWHSNGQLKAHGTFDTDKLTPADFRAGSYYITDWDHNYDSDPNRKGDWIFYDKVGKIISEAVFFQMGYDLDENKFLEVK
ncbi:MAG: hypothetical protein AAFO07_19455 [Bacteroidota bacterium]